MGEDVEELSKRSTGQTEKADFQRNPKQLERKRLESLIRNRQREKSRKIPGELLSQNVNILTKLEGRVIL